MRRSLHYLLCAVLISVLPSISGAFPTEQWQKFASSVAGFSILMPGEARESVGSDDAYGSLRSYSAQVGLDEGLFAVDEHVFAEDFDTSKGLSLYFNRFQETAARNQGKIIGQRDVSIGGMPARRVSIILGNAGLHVTMQEVFIIKGNRLFLLIAMSGAAPLPSEDIDKFFDSFTITGPAKEWKRSRSDPNEVVEKDEQEPAQVTTGITSFQCPTYPAAAKEHHTGGTVTIQVTTDGKKITDLKSKGVLVLARAAEENLRTWEFAENAPRNFTVTYIYVQEGEYEPDPVYHCRAKLELPNKIEVSANW